MPSPWRTAWITGASTGIGRELTLKLAGRGVRVAASARSEARLAELAALHPSLLPVPLDVTDRSRTAAAHARISDELGAIDLAVLNAGVWQPMPASALDATRIAESMNVNYVAIANALELLIPAMTKAGKGHIALVASMAGYRGLPNAVAYAPTKAAVISLAEVLRLELPRHGIKVSLVNPGFVETPMTSINTFPMPFIIKADDAAERILKGLERGRFEIVFPWQLATIMKLLRILPNALFLRLAGRL
ncbi:MAG TPA: SDR family NAD(P)-dependent oxidoreductase [Hyphomicrobiaceae bacterium]|nr:SDR family NAD(P)-dependent oxidoreductase [Hyphomicrobiaceae bacterium]